LLSGRAILAADLHEFCASLGLRARWLDRAPDTAFKNPYRAVPHDPAHPARSASLEQLHGRFRELEGGIFILDSGGACCLIDIEQRRFLRAPADADFSRLVQFARWHLFDEVLLDGDDIVVVPLAGAAALRFQPTHRAVAEEPVGAARAR
jgi:hypothetical protein